jgi:hypothetical protein
VNGVVYAAFSSQCDNGNWNGWLIGVSTASASITTMWAAETGLGAGAGIWQSGSAPIVDSQGNIYFSTGNGTLPSPGPGTDTSVQNLGEAVVKLSTSGGTLHLADWFVPSDAANLNIYDGDLGSGGAVALPPSMGTTQEPNVLLQVGKEGVLYALNMNSLGGYQQGPSGSDAVPFESAPSGGVWSKPAVWPGDGGYVYIPTAGTSSFSMSGGGSLNVFKRVVDTSGVVTFQLVGATSNSGSTFGFGSGKPIVTSNGTTSGSSLVWITHTSDSSGAGAELRAYDPIPQNPGPQGTLTEVWHAPIGTATKFSEPTVDSGNIYVGTENGTSDGALIGFGFGFLPTPSLTGTNVNFSPRIVSQSTTSTATFTATASTTVSSFTETRAAFSIGTPTLPLPATLSAGQTITVPITFTPNAIGALSGTLTANNTGPTAVVTLSGQGLSASSLLTATPTSANFTIQPIGGPVVHQVVTFKNVSANPVAITGFTAPVLPFTVSNPPSNATLNPGNTLSFTVNFSPPGSSGNFVHVFSGVATLITNAGNFGVPVSGSAAPPAQINIVPTTLSFGNVQVGSTASLTFNVGNQGGLPLTITSSTPPATNGFSALTTLASGTVFAANTSVQETVQFAPTSTGPVSSTWILQGNDGSGAQSVTMTGTGVAASTPPPPPPPPPPPSSGGSSSPPPPSVQSALAITTLAGHAGTPLMLATSGGTGGGAVTFRVSNGTATGCAISGSSLTVTSAGTCVVIATKAANTTNPAVSSPATTITFAAKVSTASPVTITVSFAAKSNVLSAEAKRALRALASKLVTGASVTVIGFAKGDTVLAKSRAMTVANYLASLVKIHVTLKSVTDVAVERATVTFTNR